MFFGYPNQCPHPGYWVQIEMSKQSEQFSDAVWLVHLEWGSGPTAAK
jgi:hypothetical protein